MTDMTTVLYPRIGSPVNFIEFVYLVARSSRITMTYATAADGFDFAGTLLILGGLEIVGENT
jgi:hypothetical protein